MDRPKEILKLLLVLRQIDYDCGRLVVVILDISRIAIGWTISQDDAKNKRFAMRFGTRIFMNKYRVYPQVKRELLKVLTIMKANKNYLIRANM